MRKYLIILISLLFLAACGNANEEPEKEEVISLTEVTPNNTESEKAEEEAEEVVEVPTERTLAIPGMPWEYYDPQKVDEMQNEGDIVYLYSNSKYIESRAVQVSGVDPNAEGFKNSPNNYSKEKMNARAVESIRLFLEGIQDYVLDKQDYLDKMEEVRQAMLNEEYEFVPGLIDEAKELR